MIDRMMIDQLAASTGSSVRTLRFYADAGVLSEAGRTESGYRLFGPPPVKTTFTGAACQGPSASATTARSASNM